VAPPSTTPRVNEDAVCLMRSIVASRVIIAVQTWPQNPCTQPVPRNCDHGALSGDVCQRCGG